MTVMELAERLGIGRSNATYLMKSVGFPSIRVGRQWRVDEKEYERRYATHHKVTIPTRQVKKPKKRQRRASPVPRYVSSFNYEKAMQAANEEAQLAR